MGALTIPMVFRGTPVVSGDVIVFAPRGPWRLFRRRFLGIVDLRDRSIPYLVRRHGDRVWKLPLDGVALSPRAWKATVLRLPGIDKTQGGIIAAKAAERPGEGVHHPTFDCGRECRSDEELAREAFRAAGVELTFADGVPGDPLRPVRGPQDPPNRVLDRDGAAPPIAGEQAMGWLGRRPKAPPP